MLDSDFDVLCKTAKDQHAWSAEFFYSLYHVKRYILVYEFLIHYRVFIIWEFVWHYFWAYFYDLIKYLVVLGVIRIRIRELDLGFKVPFGSCKSISGKYSIFRKWYFPERKMFSCVWLHFKKCFEKYFLMFSCVLENTIENTLSTCCSHFLTFSRLPNEYVISFIPHNKNKT